MKVGGKEVAQWKSEVDPTFLFVFTADDVHVIPVDHPENSWDGPMLVLRATAGALADRLEILGVARADLEGCLGYLVGAGIEDTLEVFHNLRMGGSWEELQAKDAAWLKSMTLEKWIAEMRAAIADPTPLDWRDWPNWPITRLSHMWQPLDTRWMLQAILTCCDPSDVIELDLTELALNEYIAASNFDPQAEAAFRFSVAAANGNPAIVVTEGTTDTEFLRAAIELRQPHLTKFVRFFDTEIRAEGSASAAVRTVKAFAAAGVNNRVVMLLDNDTAAHEATRGLDTQKLPSHYATGHLPFLDFAASYPTTGATGSQLADANGQAGAIELYLGTDVLTNPDTGDLAPVRWGAPSPGTKRYHAEFPDKRRIQQAFRAKIATAKADPAVMKDQDWTGMDLVLEQLFALVKQCTVPIPGIVGGGLR